MKEKSYVLRNPNGRFYRYGDRITFGDLERATKFGDEEAARNEITLLALTNCAIYECVTQITLGNKID